MLPSLPLRMEDSNLGSGPELSRSKLPFHRPSDVISPKRGRDAACLACRGLNAACGWLLVLRVPDPKELPASNELDTLLWGDFGCPGRLFCSLLFPGLPGDLLFPISRRYLSLLVRTVRAG